MPYKYISKRIVVNQNKTFDFCEPNINSHSPRDARRDPQEGERSGRRAGEVRREPARRDFAGNGRWSDYLQWRQGSWRWWSWREGSYTGQGDGSVDGRRAGGAQLQQLRFVYLSSILWENNLNLPFLIQT